MAYVGLGGWWEDFTAYNSPSAWGSAIADAYQRLQYGTIPAPGAGLPSPPAPAAPSNDQLLSWDPQQAAAASAGSFEAWISGMRQTIQDAENNGSYNPAGNLPVTADWMAKYGVWIALAAGVGLFALSRKGGR